MALKKSQLYSSLWQSCDELRGGMDASQYKDYVLTLLSMKYVSDKYAGKSGEAKVIGIERAKDMGCTPIFPSPAIGLV
jgi:type I restriction enzyme M protein